MKSMKYQKSHITKMNILETSKHCFYEYGYKNTTMRIIGKECNISQSLLYYYFKSKHDVATELMANFYQKSEDVLSQYINQQQEPFLYLLCLCRLLYKEVQKDPKEQRFYEEIFENGNPDRPFTHVLLKAIQEYTHNPSLSLADATIIVSIGDCVWTKLTEMNRTSTLSMTSKEILRITDITRFSYLDIDKSKLEESIACADKIVDSIPIHNFKLISFEPESLSPVNQATENPNKNNSR